MKFIFNLAFCLVTIQLLSSSDSFDLLTHLDGFSSDQQERLQEIRQLSAIFERQHPFTRSEVPIDIMIPIVEKDLCMLVHTVTFARRNVMHPICNIYVVAPPSQKIIAIAKKLGCCFVDESKVLPIQCRDVVYFPLGSDRRGWLFQQFLKLNCDEICSSEHVLVIDADTLVVRPQIFVYKNRTIFNCADEYHLPYRLMHKRLLGEDALSPFSFVSHTTLFEKSKLRHFKQHIEEKQGKRWFQAIMDLIDQRESSGFAENESYPQFVVAHYPNDFLQLYFFNISFIREGYLQDMVEGKLPLDSMTKSVSFHSWMN